MLPSSNPDTNALCVVMVTSIFCLSAQAARAKAGRRRPRAANPRAQRLREDQGANPFGSARRLG